MKSLRMLRELSSLSARLNLTNVLQSIKFLIYVATEASPLVTPVKAAAELQN